MTPAETEAVTKPVTRVRRSNRCDRDDCQARQSPREWSVVCQGSWFAPMRNPGGVYSITLFALNKTALGTWIPSDRALVILRMTATLRLSRHCDVRFASQPILGNTPNSA
jgi:hypothetical protein